MIDIIDGTKNKKRKVSKKTKKSWRKHIDIDDVNAFLDKQRFKERTSHVNSSDTQLFRFDNDGSIVKPGKLTKRDIRLALKNREPTCFSSLKPHTQVPDPITKRNRVRTKEERMSSILRQREIERKMKGILKLKEKEALKNRALAQAAKKDKHKRGDIKNDVWQVSNQQNMNDLLPEDVTEWMSSDSIRHTIKHLGVNKRKRPLSLGKKPSILPAVEAPHPGTSYNPSYSDHQELLQQIAQDELKLIKVEKHLNRVTKNMFKKVCHLIIE
jgi:nucleolar protein 53